MRKAEDRLRDEDRSKLAKLQRVTAIAAIQQRWTSAVAARASARTARGGNLTGLTSGQSTAAAVADGARPATAATAANESPRMAQKISVRRISSGLVGYGIKLSIPDVYSFVHSGHSSVAHSYG